MALPSESMAAEVSGRKGGVGPRPWTVYALLVIAIASIFWDIATGDPLSWIDALGYVLGVLFGVALWQGRTWVYTLFFALTSLSLGLMAFAFVMSVLLTDQTIPLSPLFIVIGAIQLALLLHPATKRFAGTDRKANA